MSDAIIWFGFLVAASLFTIRSLLTLWRAFSSRRWPAATGQVISSKTNRSGLGPSLFYVPKINYKYRVGDQTYESDRYSFDAETSVYFQKIEQIVSTYPAGRKVVVYYDPRCPSRSVLRNGAGINNYFKILVGVAVWFQAFKLFVEEVTR